jgi:cation transport regulator ChaC
MPETQENIAYFAYGSNMYTPRLRYRVSGCKALGSATLVGHELRFHKKSSDGSGKCDARETGSVNDVVIGVLFEVPVTEKPALDAAEGPGYREKPVTVTMEDRTHKSAIAYVARDSEIDATRQPYTWYKDFVERGAKEHNLPADYVQRFILSIAATSDSDASRERDRRAQVRP